jgi:hypothetical protein
VGSIRTLFTQLELNLHERSVLLLQNKSLIIIFSHPHCTSWNYIMCGNTKAIYLIIKDTEMKFDENCERSIYNLKHLCFINLKVYILYIF